MGSGERTREKAKPAFLPQELEMRSENRLSAGCVPPRRDLRRRDRLRGRGLQRSGFQRRNGVLRKVGSLQTLSAALSNHAPSQWRWVRDYVRKVDTFMTFVTPKHAWQDSACCGALYVQLQPRLYRGRLACSYLWCNICVFYLSIDPSIHPSNYICLYIYKYCPV